MSYQTYRLILSRAVQSYGVSPVRLVPVDWSSTVGRLLMVAASWRGVQMVSEL